VAREGADGNPAIASGCAIVAARKKTSICRTAARGGHRAVVRALREHWDETVVAAAARGGHFDLVREMRAGGCAWDGRAVLAAERGGHTRIARWMLAHGCPAPTEWQLEAAAPR
jgi:hypothetical protein